MIFETFCGNFHALSNFKYIPDEKPKHSNEKSVACFESLFLDLSVVKQNTPEPVFSFRSCALHIFDHCEEHSRSLLQSCFGKNKSLNLHKERMTEVYQKHSSHYFDEPWKGKVFCDLLVARVANLEAGSCQQNEFSFFLKEKALILIYCSLNNGTAKRIKAILRSSFVYEVPWWALFAHCIWAFGVGRLRKTLLSRLLRAHAALLWSKLKIPKIVITQEKNQNIFPSSLKTVFPLSIHQS